MKVKFKERPQYPAHVFMRAVGYAKQVSFNGEVSYVRRAYGVDFPRYHVYVQDEAEPMTLTMHIDQKAHTYEGSAAHSGEYTGQLIEQELARIHSILNVPMVIMVDKNGNPLER